MIPLPITAEDIRKTSPGDYNYSLDCSVLSRCAHIASLAAYEKFRGEAYVDYPVTFGDLYDLMKVSLEAAGFTVTFITEGHKFRPGAKVWRVTWAKE